MFLVKLSGHGTIYLEALPFSRLADRVVGNSPQAGGGSKGEGSILGGLGRMLGGDNF